MLSPQQCLNWGILMGIFLIMQGRGNRLQGVNKMSSYLSKRHHLALKGMMPNLTLPHSYLYSLYCIAAAPGSHPPPRSWWWGHWWPCQRTAPVTPLPGTWHLQGGLTDRASRNLEDSSSAALDSASSVARWRTGAKIKEGRFTSTAWVGWECEEAAYKLGKFRKLN